MQPIKYQIFVSSTYEDLKAERDQIIKASLEMGHIPVGMEMFSAANEEQWKIITRQIDQSDYYAVIVAHRYGSIVDGVSYTEKEYDYAIQQGVPVLGFVIEAAASWPANWVDADIDKKKPLDLFKEKVKHKPTGFWFNADDLHGKFSIALMKAIANNPRPGWARASEVAGPEVLTELSRLSSENAALRERLDILPTREADYLGLNFQEMCDELAVPINPYQISDPGFLTNILSTMTAFKNQEVTLLHFLWVFSDWFLHSKSLGSSNRSSMLAEDAQTELARLAALGLTQYDANFRAYSATEVGRRYLLRLRAEHTTPEERGFIFSSDNF